MLRLMAIAVLTILTLGCSRTELAYRNADSLLAYYAWRSVHTGAAQRDHWQPVLQSTLRQHREQELPLVIAYLDLATRNIRETEGTEGAACLVDGALLLYQRHARLAVDLAVPLLATLDAAQVEHLAEYTTRQQQNAVKRYNDPDPQRRKAARQERIRDRIERWTGKLNDNQRQQVNDALERIPDLSASWLAYRAQQTNTLLAMLETGTNAEALRAYLEDWWVHRDGTSTETRQLWRVARHEFIRLIDTLATTLTDKQRARLEKRLGDLRADLEIFAPRQQQPIDLQVSPACGSASA